MDCENDRKSAQGNPGPVNVQLVCSKAIVYFANAWGQAGLGICLVLVHTWCWLVFRLAGAFSFVDAGRILRAMWQVLVSIFCSTSYSSCGITRHRVQWLSLPLIREKWRSDNMKFADNMEEPNKIFKKSLCDIVDHGHPEVRVSTSGSSKSPW